MICEKQERNEKSIGPIKHRNKKEKGKNTIKIKPNT